MGEQPENILEDKGEKLDEGNCGYFNLLENYGNDPKQTKSVLLCF